MPLPENPFDNELAMMRARPAERVWCEVFPRARAANFDDLAGLVGLSELGRAWVDVSSAQAERIVSGLLHRDLAYGREVMTSHRADYLASTFLDAFGPYERQCAKNLEDGVLDLPRAFAPASGFAFDAGVAVIGTSLVGIYWVADED